MDNLTEQTVLCINKLKECQQNGDAEMAHIRADEALVELLKEIGLGDIAIEYEEVYKWYA